MWRCLADALPTNKALRSRCIDVDAFCRRCGDQEETVEHALRDCGWAEVLWSVSPLRLQPLSGVCSIKDWFEMIRSSPHRESQARFATLAWSIWYARNLLVFKQKELDHVECLAIASRAQWVAPVIDSPNQSKATKVACIREGQMKMSIDAAIVEGVGLGVGVVMRDRENNIICCRYGFRAGEFKVVDGEAFAMLESFHLCREQGILDAVFETDNQTLYWMLMKRVEDLSYLGTTLNSIYGMMSSFHQIAFSWFSRDENSLADRLASYALRNLLPFSSAGTLPHDVIPT